MMGYKKSTYEVEKRHQAAIKRALRDLPFTNEDQQLALHHHDYAYTRFFERYEAMPKSEKFVYLKEDTFKERLTRYATQEMEIITETGIGTGSYHILKYAEFWKDMLSMSAFFHRLVTERAMRLLKTYLRCAKTKEIYGMALAGRSLLELGISHASAQKVVVARLGKVFDRLQQYDDPLSVIIKVVDFSPVEHALVQGIWGTRLYTGTLGDGSKEKGKEDTSIWGNPEIPDDNIAAKNIMTDI